MRAIRRVPRSECPPRSKKLSWTPTSSVPRTSLQASARVRSNSVRGATKAAASSGRSASGRGSALRSTLPLGVSGRASSQTQAAGSM